MTINIALATYDGIILGCDSLSSITSQVIFPFGPNCEYAKDADGNVLLDASNRPYVAVAPPNVQQVPTTVFGGVSKMFALYQDDDTSVAAVTAGMAAIGGVTIAEQARRYRRKNELEGRTFNSVRGVAEHFLAYMRELWEREFEGTPEQARIYLPTILFIVAGFGDGDDHGMVFKLDVAQNIFHEQFPDDDHVGVCWTGQSDYVERLLKGVDNHLVFTANKQILEALSAQRATTVQDISDALEAANVELPENLELNITEHVPAGIPWDSTAADIDFGNLSTQYAVDLVETLVNTQSGMQRFARGIPTVGGRTHIGVLKRGEKFALLNEPKLQHKHTGYADEY